MNRPLLGVEFRLGEFGGEKCLGDIVPVFALADPSKIPQGQRIVAKAGYAVSGAEVRSNRYVDSIKLHFRRLRPDGTLDPADSYTSDWFGEPGTQGRIITLGNEGPRVIGIYLRAGLVVDGFALVLGTK
jgi:hypothetical protein